MENKLLKNNQDKNKVRIYGFSISIIVYIIFLLSHLYYSGKMNDIIKLIKNKRYILHIFIIISYIIYVFKYNAVGLITDDEDNYILDRMKDALKKAIFGFIIALLAYIDVTIGAFWIIFIAAFYFNGFI